MQNTGFDLVYLFAVFAAMAVVSFAERALPFAASKWLQKQHWVKALGGFLPLAIMVLLTVHAAAGNAQGRGAWPVAEAAGVVLTVVLQWFFKSPLVSIFAGTAFYVAAVNGFIPGFG